MAWKAGHLHNSLMCSAFVVTRDLWFSVLICTFVGCMRKMFVKYMSALLVVWYSLSIIGFDVHSCKSTGEVFVASLAGGISCEDVHPEHSCKAHGNCCGHDMAACCEHDIKSCCEHETKVCCAHEAKSCSGDYGQQTGSQQTVSQVAKSDCCSNDLQVLELTGVYASSERCTDNDHADEYVLNVDLFAEMTVPAVQRPLLPFLKYPDTGVIMPDRQAFFSIWRV